jgi:RND family efflux transporter MFP subunit
MTSISSNTSAIMQKSKKLIFYCRNLSIRCWKKIREFPLWQQLLIAVVLLLCAWWGSKWMFTPRSHGFEEPPVFISATQVVGEKWDPYIEAIGSITAVNSVIITSEVSGLVTKIHFNSGQEVRMGDTLVTLNDDVEQADLKRYQAQVQLAQITLQRSKTLTKTNAESRAEFDKKEAALKEAEAQVDQAKAVIHKKQITAPFPGELGIRQIDMGQYIQPGTAIVSLTDLSQLHIDLTVPEQHRPNLAVGQKVIIKVDAFPEKNFEAVVTTIDPQIDETTRAIHVQATMDNREKRLFPGMYVEAKILMSSQKEVLSLPETAVDYELHGTSVFLIQSQESKSDSPILRVNRQYVKAGERRDGKVEILEGLKAGDQVVLSGQLKLNNGARVILQNDQKLAADQNLTNY